MTSKEFCRLAERIMRRPAVPYHEHAVRSEIERICEEHGLGFRRDRFGNLIVTLRTRAKVRLFVLAAHMDHPGFEFVKHKGSSSLTAQFLGGVPDSYFRSGLKLRLLPGGQTAALGKRISKKQKVFEIRSTSRSADSKPSHAVWELEDFSVRNGLIHGRACDDLIGVASILATLIQLKQSRARVHVIGVISRAEEVGFHGALTVAESGSVPRNSIIVSLETSRELPGVQMGQGVIVRVGDRASIFDSAATRFLTEVGTELATPRKNFTQQRALMSGGTCEATAYQEFGYTTAAVCVALGNYHNCGKKNQIKAEYVSLADALSMVELLTSAACRMNEFEALTSRLPKRLNLLLREAKSRLSRA